MVLARWKPDLMAVCSRVREGTKSCDKVVVTLAMVVGPIAVWAVAAADVRSPWPPPVPLAWSAAGFACFAFGFAATFWAMWTNRFFAVTVRIQNERTFRRGSRTLCAGPSSRLQRDAGIHARLALIPAIAFRTWLEDRTLHAELPGYVEYSSGVRYRLVPGIW